DYTLGALPACKIALFFGLKFSDFPLLSEAVNAKDFELVSKIVVEQDPFEVKRIRIPIENSKSSPNLIPSQSHRRMVGCICEPEADSINWLELEKGDPVQCYCGHWFKLVNYEDYFNMTNQ
ncbi:Cytochrome c oxidase subunit 5B, variant 2, partial [Schistosoma haematobium]